MQHIGEALDLMSKLPCYPSPSVMELDLYLITISAKIHEGKLTEAKKFVDRCKVIAENIGIYSGSRKSKINYKTLYYSMKDYV